MIESQNPDINVALLNQKIDEVLVQREPVVRGAMTVVSEEPESSARLAKLDCLDALVADASMNAQGPQQWPRKLDRFPFVLAKSSGGFIFRLYRFLLKKQTVVNFAFVRSLQEIIRLLRQSAYLEVELQGRCDNLSHELQAEQNQQRQFTAQLQATQAQLQATQSQFKATQTQLEQLDQQVQAEQNLREQLEQQVQAEQNLREQLEQQVQAEQTHREQLDQQVQAEQANREHVEQRLLAAVYAEQTHREQLEQRLKSLEKHIAERDQLRESQQQHYEVERLQLASERHAAQARFNTAEQNLHHLMVRMPHIETQLDLQNRKNHHLIDPTEQLPEFLVAGEPDYLDQAISRSEGIDRASISSENSEQLYHVFENLFYDSSTVKHKQQHYVQYVDADLNANHPFLDVGCGRGEFLENLQDRKLQAKGIDLNGLEIGALKKRGFQVERAELLEYLKKNSEQYSGISAFQVIEHLEIDQLKAFLNIAHQRIVPGGSLILETVNPHSIYALSNFYQDPTHINPLPPEMIAFLVEWYGFTSVQILYSSPLPESFRLFSNRCMNYQDYAVIAQR